MTVPIAAGRATSLGARGRAGAGTGAGAGDGKPAGAGVGGRIPSRDLLVTLVERKLRLWAKRSWLGMVWPILAPVWLFGLYLFVFGRVFKVPVSDYPAYLFAGLLPWTFLAQSLGDGVTSLSSEADLIRRTPFRYELLPIASVTAMGLHFSVTLAGFLVVLAATGHLAYAVLPVLLVPLASLYLFVVSLSMFLALIDVYNRDLRRVLANLLTVWFFLVPIVYRPQQAEVLKPLRYIDPANVLVREFRFVLYSGQVPPTENLVEGLALCLLAFGAAIAVYRRFGDRLPREV